MAEPYYQDDAVTLYHGDCREVLADMADRSVDCVITDPPYSERTHKNATCSRRWRVERDMGMALFEAGA